MNAQNLLDIIGGAKDTYVFEALETRNGAQKTRSGHVSLKKSLLIAAIIAMMLLLVGCTIVYVLSLQDMKIGEHTYIQPRHLDENGNKVYETEITRDVVSLQGLEGTPGFLAAKEWHEFEESYDPDNEILFASDENLIDVPQAYDAYFVYTQEMIDKVDEITEKYDLQLAGQNAPFQREETDFFFDSLKLESLCLPDAQAEVEYASGYFYECGNFKMEFFFTLPQWETPYPPLGSFSYHDKDYFYAINASVTNIETCEQWIHTTPKGQQVLIVRDDSDYVKVFCDRSDAFLYLVFDVAYTDAEENAHKLSNEEVQTVVDAFDFSIRPQKPDMEKVNDYLDKAYAEAMARQQAEQATYVDPFALESYREYVDYLIDNMNDPKSLLYGFTPDTLFYTILDFDGDGTDDFLWGLGDKFSNAVTMKDGTIEMLFGNGRDSYLCENYIIEQSYTGDKYNPNYYSYLQFADGSYTEIHDIQYDRDTGIWTKAIYDSWGSREEITEQEARAIIGSYTRVDLNMKPLSEFPVE